MGVTIDDLAALANTSTATVSRALNNKPGVTEATRQRILMLADKLGYRPNQLARNLALQKSHVLGIIGADLLNTFYIHFFRNVQQRAEPLGYQLLLADSERSVEKEKRNIDVMLLHRAEGFLIFPVGDWQRASPVDHLMELRLRRFPFVVVGRVEGLDCDWVTSDELEVAGISARHLIALGHRRVAFVGHMPENRCVVERLEGVSTALARAGCPMAANHVIHHTDDWAARMKEMLRAPDRPTALVYVNDVVALMAKRHLADLGLRVPQDLSVTAFDDGLWTRHATPSVTTTAENEEEVTRVAVDMLLRRIADPDAPTQQRLVPQRFIIRESTGPAPGA